MRILILITAILHGLIHLIGFAKGFGLAEIKEITAPVSKPTGLLWSAAAALFTAFGILYYADHKYAWVVGFVAVAVSQVLIIAFWKDAKFGTLPNLIILLASLGSFGAYQFHKSVRAETDSIIAQNAVSEEKILAETDAKDLPLPVQRWLHASGAIGKPYVQIGKVTQKAEMKMDPDQDDWMHATAVQYTTVDNPAFIWTVDLKMNAFISFRGRDKFENGKGEMLIKMNSLINVVNERGEKLDEGTVQRYLGEMAWFPSLALSPHITWEQVNDTAARATMNYLGTEGSGTFCFNKAGDLEKFSAMRYRGNEADAKREEWILSVIDYKTFEGIKVPANMTATWKLDEGDWTWLKLKVTDLNYNKNVRR